MAKDFKQGVLVWAKMKGFPPWPAKVAFPTDGKIPKSKKPQHYVYFFGTHDFAWILDQYIFPHSEEMLENAKSYKKISSTMQAAIQEIEQASRKGGKKFKLLTKDKIKQEPVGSPPPPEIIPEKTPNKSTKKPVPNRKIKVEKKDIKVEKETIKVEKETIKVEKEAIKVEKGTIKVEKKTPKKRSARVMSNADKDVKVKVKKDEDLDEDYSVLMANAPHSSRYPNVAVIPPYSDDTKPNFASYLAETVFDSPSTSSIIRSQVKPESFPPTSKKIGFLGLGAMGCELVKRLLSTGHTVTIWNRRVLDIYTTFVEMGATTARNPSDVVQECDITFCCVSTADAAKNVVFGHNGVLAGFDGLSSSKAYVEMTSIDPVTSQEISEAIAGKGGRYLEAPMIGTRPDASTNTLSILTAGDRAVFTDCNSVFSVWAKHALYLGCDVGAAVKMSLILNMLAGTTYAALAESLSMIDERKVNPAFFMEMVGSSPASFPLLMDKGFAMITNDRTVYTPIKNQQKDLNMAVALGEKTQQPLALAVAANEVYKRALKDEESDVSAICRMR